MKIEINDYAAEHLYRLDRAADYVISVHLAEALFILPHYCLFLHLSYAALR